VGYVLTKNADEDQRESFGDSPGDESKYWR
jgi:hypothetical protein